VYFIENIHSSKFNWLIYAANLMVFCKSQKRIRHISASAVLLRIHQVVLVQAVEPVWVLSSVFMQFAFLQ